MDKLKVVIILLVLFSIGLLIFNFAFFKSESNFLQTARNLIFGSQNIGNENKGSGAGEISNGEESGGSQTINEIKENLDVNGDSILECDLISDYYISGDMINVTIEGNSGSFIFSKVKLQQYIQPDKPDTILLEYQVLPDNADNVIYSNLFFSSDADIYLCY